MSRHEGVSCDSCLKGNFRGRRYKCLICYDYDLCSTCYEAGATTTRHTTDHPMQCILTRSDFDMYYGGEALTAEQPQSFTCPYCCKMGYTDATLHEHVTAEHTDVSLEVVCPICASLPGGEPNHVTDDFASHLALEHRTPRDFDEPPGLRHVRRIPHPGRGGGSRTRRANMHFGSSANTLTGLSPSGRENMDPIAELLSQLSSVRNRAAAAQSVSSQLQQLEMQLQSTRFLTMSPRQQLERMPRRQAEAKTPANNTSTTGLANPESLLGSQTQAPSSSESQFLLAKIADEVTGGGNQSGNESERVERNMFVQELLLSTLTEQLQLATHTDDPYMLLDSLRTPSSNTEHKTSGTGSVSASSTVKMEETGSSKNRVVEVHCKSKGGGASALGTPPPGNTSSSSSNTGGKLASGSAGMTGGVHQDGRVSTSGGAAVASATGSSASAFAPAASYPPHSPRPSPVAAALSPPSVQQQQQPQGPSISLSVQHEHGLPHARPAANSMSPRDTNRLNPAAAKRSMLKHLPASRGATDTDPPPH